jgi:hypothetical protein
MITRCSATDLFSGEHVHRRLGFTENLSSLRDSNSGAGFTHYSISQPKNKNNWICVLVILPETKGISLEHLGKLLGEVDTVAAGEQETPAENIEAVTDSRRTGNAMEVDMLNRAEEDLREIETEA